MVAGNANAMAELMALRTPGTGRGRVEDALAAVSSGDVPEVYRFAGRWGSRQLPVIADHHDAARDENERVLCLHLVLARAARLGVAEQRFVDSAISRVSDDTGFLGRWARALALAHRDEKPHLVADHLDDAANRR
jgi:hypothetical protein